jgi:hypothetical protein
MVIHSTTNAGYYGKARLFDIILRVDKNIEALAMYWTSISYDLTIIMLTTLSFFDDMSYVTSILECVVNDSRENGR